MGTGQSLFAIIAIILLTSVATKVNDTILNTQDTTQNSKFALVAISLAKSRIEEINRLAYDEATLNNAVNTTNSLTASGTLGLDAYENAEPAYDDCDDYNNFTEVDSTLQSAIYKIVTKINYVTASNPDGYSTSQTWHKRITVTVTSNSMKDTVRLYSIYSYFAFR